MKRTNIHRQTSFARVNAVKAIICGICFHLCSYPRLLIELFIKDRFGERYFGLASVITATVALCLIPYFMESGAYGAEISTVLARHFVWYIYAAALLYFGIARYKELKRTPGVFDFSRYSLCTGILFPRIEAFWKSVLGHHYRLRISEIYLEPLPFFLLGLLISAFHEPFGLLLSVCSVLYSVSYTAAYWMADYEIMDMIDDLLVAEQARAIVMENKSPAETKGVQMRFQKPTSDEYKMVLVDRLEKEGYAEDEHVATVF